MVDIPNVASGAHAVLRGYENQFMYAPYCILNSQEALFQLERFEDIEVLDDQGEPLTVIQVKDLASNLTYSDLRDESSTNKCFFRRALKVLENKPDTKIILASFGVIGPEIQAA